MASHENMIPTGLPYGERQQYEQAAQVAGLPSSVPAGGAFPSSPTPAPSAAADSLRGFDVFQNRQPSGVISPAPDPGVEAAFQAQVASSPNPNTRYYFADVAEYLGG